VKEWLEIIFMIFIGLSGGIAVGSGMVAFLVVLDIIPRLTQLTRSAAYLQRYEEAVIIGSVVFTLADFHNVSLTSAPFLTGLFGLFAGCFVGMLAAALTEVINVLPILAKRIGMEPYMVWLLMAMVLGKVCGSLFEWLFY
jgi:stage V sporulation protein AB